MRKKRKNKYKIQDRCFFTREQLLDRDYDPLSNYDIDLEYLNERFSHYVQLDHAAAIRAILVREGTKWNWIWGIGLLHDQMLVDVGYPKLYARYRNQFQMLPRIEFHAGADIRKALMVLLQETPIHEDDVINIESESSGRWMSIGEYLGK